MSTPAPQPPTCPICGASMKPYGRGATRNKPAARWVCPVARKEVFVKDENGRLQPNPDARHKDVRVWSDAELEAEAPHCLPPTTVDHNAELALLQAIAARLDIAVETGYLAADLLIPHSPEHASAVRNAARRLDSLRKDVRAATSIALSRTRQAHEKEQDR